jgi:hypothetical protein
LSTKSAIGRAEPPYQNTKSLAVRLSTDNAMAKLAYTWRQDTSSADETPHFNAVSRVSIPPKLAA